MIIFDFSKLSYFLFFTIILIKKEYSFFLYVFVIIFSNMIKQCNEIFYIENDKYNGKLIMFYMMYIWW